MANKQNLCRRSSGEAREFGKMGGIASGEARRYRAKLRADLEELLNSPNPEGQGETVQTAICISLIERAIRGDTKAFEIIRDTIGEKPAERITLAQIDQATFDEVEKVVMRHDANKSET